MQCLVANHEKKWHPSEKRLEYLTTCAIDKWKSLTSVKKETHTLGNCIACYRKHQDLQTCFPGRPFFYPSTMIIKLPKSSGSSFHEERDHARSVLSELNSAWADKFTHTFFDGITQKHSSSQLVHKEIKN